MGIKLTESRKKLMFKFYTYGFYLLTKFDCQHFGGKKSTHSKEKELIARPNTRSRQRTQSLRQLYPPNTLDEDQTHPVQGKQVPLQGNPEREPVPNEGISCNPGQSSGKTVAW